jgi:hypothetical protein
MTEGRVKHLNDQIVVIFVVRIQHNGLPLIASKHVSIIAINAIKTLNNGYLLFLCTAVDLCDTLT